MSHVPQVFQTLQYQLCVCALLRRYFRPHISPKAIFGINPLLFGAHGYESEGAGNLRTPFPVPPKIGDTFAALCPRAPKVGLRDERNLAPAEFFTVLENYFFALSFRSTSTPNRNPCRKAVTSASRT